MDYKALADAGFIADAKLIKSGETYYLEDGGIQYDLSAILDYLLGKDIRLTVISRDVLLDIEKAVVNDIKN